MNQDCHYYGTYYIARAAGFDHEEAYYIAWAAESVDQCHIEHLEEIAEKLNISRTQIAEKTNFILTLTEPLDGSLHLSTDFEMIETQADNIDHLTALRAMWMPFHFLPGNFPGAIPDDQLIKYWGKHGINSQDNHDLSLMCRTSTETCKEIIENARIQYQKYKNSEETKTLGLFAIGIAMHVLADTWSHEFFCGSPNRKINLVNFELSGDESEYIKNGIAKRKRSIDCRDFAGNTVTLASVNSESDYTMASLGHGTAGHLPDQAYRDYDSYHVFLSNINYVQDKAMPQNQRYKVKYPHELVKSGNPIRNESADGIVNYTTVISEQYIPRDNPTRFLNAFTQMLEALIYIRAEESMQLILTLNKDLKRGLGSKASNFDQYNELLEELPGRVFTQKTNDQSQQWIELIHKKHHLYLPKYVFFNKDEPYSYNSADDFFTDSDCGKFMQMAIIHRDNVIQYIKTNYEINGNPVFTRKNVDLAVRRFFLDAPKYGKGATFLKYVLEIFPIDGGMTKTEHVPPTEALKKTEPHRRIILTNPMIPWRWR